MFRLDIRSLQQVRRQLRRFIDKIDDLEPLWLEYGQIMADYEARWFDTAGDGTWPPLAESTEKQKLAAGFPPDPLIRTGDLFHSLTDPLRAGQIGQGRTTLGTFTGKSFTWGTDVVDHRGKPYAHYHQHVDQITGEPVDYGDDPPERQVIPWPLPPDLVEEMEQANRVFVEKVIKESGL